MVHRPADGSIHQSGLVPDKRRSDKSEKTKVGNQPEISALVLHNGARSTLSNKEF